jgi:hypothetical protein
VAHDDGVVAGAGVEAIGTSPSAHVVVASAAPEVVVFAAGENTVVPVPAVDVVGPATREDQLVARAGEEVVPASSCRAARRGLRSPSTCRLRVFRRKPAQLATASPVACAM